MIRSGVLACALLCVTPLVCAQAPLDARKFQAWRLPAVSAPADNATTPARVELGKMLFFDPRFSNGRNMSCASCHNPSLGWADGLATAVGHNGKKLRRATPSVTNAAYNTIQMWDGRKATLEDQALGPLQSQDEMHADFDQVIQFLSAVPGYRSAFAAAYPGEPISQTTFAKAIAAYERTIVVQDSAFDRWLRGEAKLSAAAQRGFSVFTDPNKGNCAVCHSAPSFTDNGFHNIGLASFGMPDPDLGRFNERRVPSLRGAFKTPQLRDVARTAPYFHDGSASTLREVIEHYRRGGEVKTNLSRNMKPLALTDAERDDLVAFLESLNNTAPLPAPPWLPSDVGVRYPDRNLSAASVARGEVAFQRYCASCHGKTGEGDGRAAKLHNPRPTNLTVSDKNKAYKELIVRQGGAALGRSPAMPAWNAELTDEQVTDIVNFLQSLVVPSVVQNTPVK